MRTRTALAATTVLLLAACSSTADSSTAGSSQAGSGRMSPGTRSFGTATYGVPTGNAPHRLSDGAVILLTGAAEADRTGRVHEGRIEPDEFVDPRKDGDPALTAAVNWLAQHAACAKS